MNGQKLELCVMHTIALEVCWTEADLTEHEIADKVSLAIIGVLAEIGAQNPSVFGRVGTHNHE